MIEPLDLQSILVNHLSGSIRIFVFIAFIAIAALAARFRMTGGATLLLMAIFVLCLSVAIPDIYFIMIVIGGTAIFYGIIKMFKY